VKRFRAHTDQESLGSLALVWGNRTTEGIVLVPFLAWLIDGDPLRFESIDPELVDCSRDRIN